jgi:hypothetical protein
VSDEEPKRGGEFEKDVEVDKPGIVGARWWHKSLQDEAQGTNRRQVLVGMAVFGAAGVAVLAGVGSLIRLAQPETTALTTRKALDMQKQYGWDFGARGVPLVFDGKVEGPFVRTTLGVLPSLMTPAAQGPNAKYHVGTLTESLLATPTATLPDPEDGRPAPDSAPFKRVADVLMPVITPAMQRAYAVGEALARLAAWRQGLAVLVDLPGPEAVAFAAGAAAAFEPVLLLDNWPHPHGVVPSHLTLAALAYYQPRFASQKERVFSAPLFVLDRARLSPYSEETDRFDNRYYARMPKLQALAKDGVRALLYVVSSPRALPEPADLSPILAAGPGAAGAETVEVRALALTDFASDAASGQPDKLYYGGTAKSDATFWDAYAFGAKSKPDVQKTASTATADYRFTPSAASASAVPANLGKVAVIATASGLILAGALDRRGSMNRFAGGWSG